MRETTNLEYKQELTKTYLKTVSAFANYETGEIIFGVDDAGNAVGLDNPKEACLIIENTINGNLKPVPKFKLSVNDAEKTVVLTVYKGKQTPYFYNNKAYRRADSSTVEVDRLELTQLVLKGANETFDSLESSQQDLKFEKLKSELIEKAGIEKFDENVLISLELKEPKGYYNNAAALLADKNTFGGVDVARFGEDINSILSRHTLSKQSLLAQLEVATEIFDEHYTYEKIIGVNRIKKELIPREAFREAIANALVHCRWDMKANINVGMYPDRIEIKSPGGLPEGMSEESYLNGGPSIARNPILANVFFRLGYIERFGTGIPRIRDAYADKEVSPIFSIEEMSVSVVLPSESFAILSREEREVLRVIPKEIALTRNEIEVAANISKDKTIRILKNLEEKKMVTRIGNGRSTKYYRA